MSEELNTNPGTPAEGAPPTEGAAPTPWFQAEGVDLSAHLSQFESAEAFTNRLEATTIPSVDAPGDVWGEFYNKLGRPESVAEYQWNYGEGLPEEFKFGEEAQAEIFETFHKQGITASQAEALSSLWGRITEGDIAYSKEQQAAEATNLSNLAKEWWGADKVEQSQQEAAAFFEGTLQEEVPHVYDILKDQPDVVNNPVFQELLRFAAKAYAPGGTQPAIPSTGPTPNLSPQEAYQQWISNPDNMARARGARGTKVEQAKAKQEYAGFLKALGLT